MATWTRKPQECEGTYVFGGQFLVSAGVKRDLPFEEITQIYQDTLRAVKEKGGLDYLQVFENDRGVKLFFIDSLPKEDLESGEIDPTDVNYNNCVLCYPHER